MAQNRGMRLAALPLALVLAATGALAAAPQKVLRYNFDVAETSACIASWPPNLMRYSSPSALWP